MSIFNVNHLAFEIWNLCPFPHILSYGAVHSSWNSRLYPYDIISRTKRKSETALKQDEKTEWALPQCSPISPRKLWLTTVTSIQFKILPDTEGLWEHLHRCLQNLKELKITSRHGHFYMYNYMNYTAIEGIPVGPMFARLLCSLYKLTCREEIFISFLHTYTETGLGKCALREVIVIEKNDCLPMFVPDSLGSPLLSEITHFTSKGTDAVAFSDLIFLFELQVLTCLVEPSRGQPFLHFDFSPCKKLKLMRFSDCLSKEQIEKLRKRNPGITVEIVE